MTEKMKPLLFKDVLEEKLKDPDFKRRWEELQPELEIQQAIIDYRIANNCTQREAAKRIGMDRADLNRFEKGICNPTLSTLQKIAKAIGKKLVIQFV